MNKNKGEFDQALNPQNHTILIIDDEAANLAVVADYLAQSGFQIKVTQTGEAGLELARRTPPDLILLDVRLPGVDGFEVCRRLKADQRTHDIPVIFMTIVTGTEDKVRGFEAGGVDYITKPFQKEEVLARVATHLRLRDLTQTLEEANKGLELRVAKRTAELSQANARLEEEIAERKRVEIALQQMNRELRAISNCNQTLMRADDEQTLLNDICRIVCAEAGYRMAWVGYAEHDDAKTVRPVAWDGIEDGYLATANITWADTERGHGPSGRAIRGGETHSIQDFTTDPLAAPWRDNALQRGYRSTIALPLRDENATPFGILCIYSTEPGTFTADEIRLLEELAGDLAFGICVLRTRTERQQAEKALRESEYKLGEAARIAHVGYWDRDYVAESIALSEEACNIFGLPLQNRLPKLAEWHAQWLNLIHPEDRLRAAQAASDALAGGPPYNVDYRVIRPGGEVRYIHSYAEVARDKSGKPSRMFGTMIDVTERKQAEDEIRKLNQELEQRVAERTTQLEAANKELEAFAYSISHDLRAPLRHIGGFVEMLKQSTEIVSDEQSRHYIEVISDAVQRMKTMIGDLLSFSRMSRSAMSSVRVDLGALMRGVLQEFEIETKDREIEWQISPLPEVNGDRAMLRMVFENLISNALKFTKSRAPAKIEVGWRPAPEDGNIIFIRDNGVGFDMKYADRLFGVFQRLHREEDFEGTGIGLANVRRIIERHGGKVWAEGKVDYGATFYFLLPHTRSRRSPESMKKM